MQCKPSSFVLSALAASFLCGVGASDALGQDAGQPTPEQQVQQAIDAGNFSLAVKAAIVHFRPDLHCHALVSQAAAEQKVAQRVALVQQRQTDELMKKAWQALSQARGLRDQARELAGKYVQAGWDATLAERVERMIEDQLSGLDALATALEQAGQQAKSLDVLMAQATIGSDDIQQLDDASKLIMGLYFTGRGEFDRALRDCFQSVQLESTGPLKALAADAGTLLSKWHTPAPDGNRWDNLVNTKGLDAYEALRKSRPGMTHLAGWYLALVAHLARDHYDVPIGTIKDTLELLEALSLPAPTQRHEELLAARLRHERCLLARRMELHGSADPPPEQDVELFRSMSDHWYAAEAALIAASTSGGAAAEALLQRSREHIEILKQVNAALAADLNEHISRYGASAMGFEQWLELAKSPDYQDRRGTVLPDILVETRAELAKRVRAGFEGRIAAQIEAGELDVAFQTAQQAKALAVGRTLTVPPDSRPQPLSEAELIASKLMSTGAGGENLISQKELFIEYFYGPTRAWAFYVFAPGDNFEPLRVVELDRAQFADHCTAAIESAKKGEPLAEIGDWLLAGRDGTALSTLWDRLGEVKKPEPLFRRVVISPDGPLCYVPLHDAAGAAFAAVTYLPTAAVLKSADFIAARDVRLMWDQHRSSYSEQLPKVSRRGAEQVITLWPGQTMPIVLRDLAH
ncbi:MAG: hypothetical protein IID41_12500 [Planctomycetes bacterium]|nr:hypothetical protein [Planctomycetota bacterium]